METLDVTVYFPSFDDREELWKVCLLLLRIYEYRAITPSRERFESQRWKGVPGSDKTHH